MSRTAWLSFMFARSWHAFRRDLPWSLMDFLSDAHRRGVLRQAGAFYQFRHVELQHRLVARNADLLPAKVHRDNHISEVGQDEIGSADHISAALTTTPATEPSLVTPGQFDGTALSEVVANAMRHATSSRQPGVALDTKAILLALMRVDVHGDWSRICLETGSFEIISQVKVRDPDETTSSDWEGTALTATLASALRTAARVARQYHLEPMPVGVLLLGLIANPASGAARSLGVGGRVDHELLVDLIQETLIGIELEDLDLSA